MRVQPLTEELARSRMDDLVGIERETVASFGAAYADDRWAEREFLWPVPSKWTLSTCVVLPDRALGGFWMASAATPGIAHVHRVALRAAAHGRGLYRAMGDAWLVLARGHGLVRFSAFVSAANDAAARFYVERGFTALAGEALQGFLKETGRELLSRDGVVLGGDGHEKQLWYRDDRG